MVELQTSFPVLCINLLGALATGSSPQDPFWIAQSSSYRQLRPAQQFYSLAG